MRRVWIRLAALGLAAACAPPVLAREAPAATATADPLGSPMWAWHAKRLFGSARVVFDDRVHVTIPDIAENQHAFPVTVDARGLPGARRIVLIVDLNPIPVPVDMTLAGAAPFLATRVKLDQRTPVRAAVLTDDGAWHVAGGWIDAAGGGCSAPPVSRAKGDWADHLGEMRGASWRAADGQTRVRFSFRHPMDTGLVENIPAYNIERVTVAGPDGKPLADLTISGSVSEDPAFTLLVPGIAAPVTVAARDSNGREFGGAIPAPTRALAIR